MKTHDRALSRLASSFSPEELRHEFLLSGLFEPGEISLHWWETDRTVVGGVCPVAGDLPLPNPDALRAACFFERREAGILNLGGPGVVRVDGTEHRLDTLDALYVGRGAREVVFGSRDAAKPARFYLLSYPAHAAYPTRHIVFRDVAGTRLGSREGANERTLYKLIHPGAFPTCQLVMGVTRLEPGSVWNTMPPHTHLRRSEAYLYFNLPPEQAVFHFMGHPGETRHLVVRDGEVVLSPPWSIHCGVGTSHYSFVWGMGGENQEFADMDPAPISVLR
ncbi:MAG: 5-dehydro-4-deoxy-D-glucuronate isomerase [Verrucomicrobia bacterium]|nr:5-dehydro-4-deoxy-D-glucuronate isomerase [Verrucomicrobiota bacterium]